ncbi:MAG TPA: SbcC/MukB-like Walker B domain-containing protein [Steroidobacter sp.]|uniref:ATP-binding protein n=1 Tax=Steroidobacter sp. TaxID=1978227 RepID=UPI002ED7D010
MFLKRLVLVNWGNIPNGEFDFGPISLFSGGNGSGKTTAADAIQTVMTAAHENLFHFNPGQEETTQRGRGGKRVRTLASYVLGCDDGSYARTEATDGYLAAVFHPTKGETAESFTAVVAMRAWLDQSGKQPTAREEPPLFFILPGTELGLDDFIRQRGDAKHVVLRDEIQEALIKRYRKGVVERYDQKRAYLRRLYAALRGKRDSVAEREAMAAAKAFSRFMAYKPISGINAFVAEEVLERKDLGEAIRSVSGQLKTIHAMEREAQSFKDSAQLLEAAGNHAQTFIETWADRQTAGYVQAKAEFLDVQTQYLRARQERDGLKRQLEENVAEVALAEQRRMQAHDAVVLLEAQRQNVEPLRQKDELDKRARALNEQFAQVARELLTQDQRLQENFRSARALSGLLSSPSLMSELPQLTDMHTRQLADHARSTDKAADIDLTRLLQRDHTGDMAMLEKHLDDARTAQRAHNDLVDHWKQSATGAPSRRDQLGEAHHGRRQKYDQLSAQCRQKEAEVERLEAKQTVYPAYVERALAAIRSQLPKADPRVLCDHIEVTDPRWQMAVEGYLGGARFNIIVDPAFEADAIRLVRSFQGRDNRARIVQGAKALRDAARIKPPANSIVHVLKFTHAIAQAFLTASYGLVERVESAEELRQTARGVTADGMGSGNYSMFRCDIPDADLVFGAAARERALRARREELENLRVARNEANERMQETARLLETVDKLQNSSYADSIASLLSVHREIRAAELLIEQLDVSEYESLDLKLSQLKEEERAAMDALNRLSGEAGGLKVKIEQAARRIETLGERKDKAQEAMLDAEQALQAVHAVWPEFSLEARLRFADQEAASFNAERAASEREQIESRLATSERAMSNVILQHNQKCRPVDAVVYTAFNGVHDAALFQAICDLRREIDRIYNILKNNVLVEKHEQLQTLKQSFNDAFVSHLCQEIYQSILDGQRQLDGLNKELVNHRFGSDREQFRFAAEWVPEFKEYWRFLEEVVRNPAMGEGTTLFEAELSPKSAAVRDSLMSLLLGADEQQSLRELERIADYRNYHRYEIYKEVEGKPPIALSEYGTGSGGQLETPAYIVRAASITSALRYGEGVNHLRMVLVDEAFSKMDEARSREVIDYLTRSLGLQLVFIMPTSKCGPFMDLISNEFVFAKVPSAPRGQLNTRVLVDRKECNKDRIGELWAQHRRTVRQQAELDFMDDVIESPPPRGKVAAGRG